MFKAQQRRTPSALSTRPLGHFALHCRQEARLPGAAVLAGSGVAGPGSSLASSLRPRACPSLPPCGSSCIYPCPALIPLSSSVAAFCLSGCVFYWGHLATSLPVPFWAVPPWTLSVTFLPSASCLLLSSLSISLSVSGTTLASFLSLCFPIFSISGSLSLSVSRPSLCQSFPLEVFVSLCLWSCTCMCSCLPG